MAGPAAHQLVIAVVKSADQYGELVTFIYPFLLLEQSSSSQGCFAKVREYPNTFNSYNDQENGGDVFVPNSTLSPKAFLSLYCSQVV